MMWVSHETIYQALYVQGRGELRRELARCLRTGRARRRPRGRDGRSGHIKDMVMISERPAEAGDRAVPGHWEGDLIIGKDCKSAVGTLVERTTRYVLLLHLPRRPRRPPGRAAPCAGDHARCPPSWPAPSPGTRASRWPATPTSPSPPASRSTSATRTHPGSAASNENTNGLLRQYLPKGTDLSVHSAEDLARIARSLNGRPRKTLGFMTPSEKLAELLAHTG